MHKSLSNPVSEEDLKRYEKSANAIVLGGGDGLPVTGESGPKGFVKILGKPMVEWVIEALIQARSINKIALVIPSDELLSDELRAKIDYVVISDGTFKENIMAGIEAVGTDLHFAGVTGDIPALTPEAVDDLVVRTFRSGADYGYPLISEADLDEQFPGSVRTYVKIKGGKMTGGNMMVASPKSIGNIQALIDDFFDTRKSPTSMARVLGPKFVLKLASGKLDPVDVAGVLGKMLDAPCVAVTTNHASLGADVDKPVDKEVIERALLASR